MTNTQHTRSKPALAVIVLAWLLLIRGGDPVAAQTATPTTSENVFSARTMGAVGDGVNVETAAIQRAIDAAFKAGGGTVLIPPGRYLTGPVFLKSNIAFHIAAGATLVGIAGLDSYPLIDGRWEGIEGKCYASLITAFDAENIAITGQGRLDGQGEFWWNSHEEHRKYDQWKNAGRKGPPPTPKFPLYQHPRPRLINLYRCRNVVIRDVTLMNSPSWTLHPVYCEDVLIDNVKIQAPRLSANTDGINPDSCRNVRIANCRVQSGDDCITLKSGRNADGRAVGKPCENIAIVNCILGPARNPGIVIGSEMSGGVRNVTVANCVIDDCGGGIFIKTKRGRGGVVEHFRAENLVMRNVGVGIELIVLPAEDDSQAGRDDKKPVDETTPELRHLMFNNITMVNAKWGIRLQGLGEMPISRVGFHDIQIDAEKGVLAAHIRNLAFDRIELNTRQYPAFRLREVEGLVLAGIATEKSGVSSFIEMRNVRDARVRDCRAPANTDVFLSVLGEKSADIRLRPNELDGASKPVATGEGALEASIIRQE